MRTCLCTLLVCSLGAVCLAATNSSSLQSRTDEATEATRERFRRLIPYMTFYYSQQQFGNRPNFQQLSGAGHVLNPSANKLFTPTAATYANNAHQDPVQYPSNGQSGEAQYSDEISETIPYKSSNNAAPSGTHQYTSNNIAAFLAPYLTRQASTQQLRPRYLFDPSSSLSYSTNNIVSGGLPFGPHNSLPATKGVLVGAKTPAHTQSLRLYPVNYEPAGTPATYPANHVHPALSSSPVQNAHSYATPSPPPAPAFISPSQATVESYRPVNRPRQNVPVPVYHTPASTQLRPSAADTLSQILDLLRAAGRLPPVEEDDSAYSQLPSTPVHDPALYRVPSTTPVPKPIQSLDEDDYAYYDDDVDVQKPVLPSPKATPFQLPAKLTPLKAPINQNYPQPEGGTPGRPGIDYPTLYKIPETTFDCKTQRYKGFFGDPETNCQVWHYCDLNGGQASFLCPNGTIFSQVGLTCDWWFNVKCDSTVQLYVLNERLYKYILPVTPSFPEDYHGPVVDRYLELKFREKEAKEEEKRKQASAESNTTT